mgnify:CR=1 FL=1
MGCGQSSVIPSNRLTARSTSRGQESPLEQVSLNTTFYRMTKSSPKGPRVAAPLPEGDAQLGHTDRHKVLIAHARLPVESQVDRSSDRMRDQLLIGGEQLDTVKGSPEGEPRNHSKNDGNNIKIKENSNREGASIDDDGRESDSLSLLFEGGSNCDYQFPPSKNHIPASSEQPPNKPAKTSIEDNSPNYHAQLASASILPQGTKGPEAKLPTPGTESGSKRAIGLVAQRPSIRNLL